jgi:hypothetical protein
MVPDHAEVARTLAQWRVLLKRDQAAAKAIEDAQVLVAHDEQWKALVLLEQCVPHFVTDHPSVVEARSQLRERLLFARDPGLYAEHYETGGTKPEDFQATADDQRAVEVAELLPRAHFLLDTVRELEGLAA